MKKIIKTLLVVMVVALAIAVFTGCEFIPEQPTEPAECTHQGTIEYVPGKDSTCTEDGLTSGFRCTACGVMVTPQEVDKAEHHFEPATCTKPEICTVCRGEGAPALGHAFTVPVEAKEPACEEVGYNAHNDCERCGEHDETYVEVDALEHSFPEEGYFYHPSAPTCTEGAYIAGVCEHCGGAYLLQEVPALGHAWVDATCTAPKTCEACGATEGEVLAHNYVNGVCSACQAQDPTYVDYYLVGYINGADYGCEGDYANLGEYKFVEGKLVVTFTQDSYVFVKSGNLKGESVKWYLFESYTTGKEGVLIENKSEKMFVPGNVEVTFTLTVNEDGTLTLAMDYHTHTFGEATCTAPAKCECGETQGEALGHADTDGDYKCDRCSTKMLPADGTALTIPEALAIAKVAGTSYTTQKYYITGIVTNVYNTTYGNLYLKDAEGNQICIYGLYTWDKAVRYDKMEYKPVEGDELTVYTVLGMYNTTAQGKDAWMDEVVAHEHDYKDVVTEPTCTKAGFTTHTCTICNGYVVDTEVEALGHTTENGVCERCELTIGGDVVNKETFKADFDTVTSTNSSYVSSTTKSGWKATNSAVMGGGTTDSNPKFKVFGAASTRAFTLNGKTSAKGKLVSPTLADGLSLLTFNYTNCFSESNGVDITITILQNGEAVATKRLDNNTVTKLTAYTFTWDLEAEGIAVTGDFTIEITNNSPSNNTGNKDRVSIWNLEWTNNPAA